METGVSWTASTLLLLSCGQLVMFPRIPNFSAMLIVLALKDYSKCNDKLKRITISITLLRTFRFDGQCSIGTAAK